MALLKQLNIDSGEQNRKFEDVSVPELGDNAEIRIQKMSVKGNFRMTRLHKTISEMDVDDDTRAALNMTATMMCCMVDEDGDYLLPGENVAEVLEVFETHGVFMRLFVACNRVNGIKVDKEVKDLTTAKKNS